MAKNSDVYRFYTEQGKVFSVDLIIDTINKKRMTPVDIDIKDLLPQLNEKVWSKDARTDPSISPIDVLQNPNAYESEFKAIVTADTRYPILIRQSNGLIVDGFHRLAHSLMHKKKSIAAHMIPDRLLGETYLCTYKELQTNTFDLRKLDGIPTF